MRTIFDTVGSAAVFVFAILWTFGGVIGAVYWSFEEDWFHAILSLVIPLYGAITVIFDLLFG